MSHKKGESMTKIFYSAQDVADLIGVSVSKAYQIIAQMNSELKEKEDNNHVV